GIMKFFKWLGKTFFMGVGFIVLFVFYYFASPESTARYVKAMFSDSGYSDPKDFDCYMQRVDIFEDIDYGSAFLGGTMDIIRPKERQEKLPVVFWMHGGAYVGGDKKDTEPYSVLLADRGYVVVNMNYALAPEEHYPAPLLQIGEAYRYIEKHAQDYLIDLDNVYFGGDSAGAQIMSVFLNAQTYERYAQETGIPQVVENKETIRGALLFCGPYDMPKLADINAPVMGLMLNRAACAYMNDKKWYTSQAGKLNALTDKVTTLFPPAFLTDGNTGSFEGHAIRMEAALKEKGVEVECVLYPRKEKILMHEYQFNLAEKYALMTFEKTVEFMERTAKKTR
ncbi:MAG: alpha/beta hydrolase, partial [Christensenella sp.]|uniref:alpha/beta hydrolase n=1 Tax=Christensenella sp. TaxID=1935934 RepID=UPI002B2005EA